MTKEELIILRDKLISKMQSIKNWFAMHDYIELQACRGTIDRNSDKYKIYLSNYNKRLAELKSLKNEFENTTIQIQDLEAK